MCALNAALTSCCCRCVLSAAASFLLLLIERAGVRWLEGVFGILIAAMVGVVGVEGEWGGRCVA